MKTRILILALAVVLGAGVFAQTLPALYMSDAVASYYGEKFHGKKTSSGEFFDMNAMTAAHRNLPFNTIVRVTNLANGKTALVRINDRGPFVMGREIDLSQAAATELGMLESGVARVAIEIVELPRGASVQLPSGNVASNLATAPSFVPPPTGTPQAQGVPQTQGLPQAGYAPSVPYVETEVAPFQEPQYQPPVAQNTVPQPQYQPPVAQSPAPQQQYQQPAQPVQPAQPQYQMPQQPLTWSPNVTTGRWDIQLGAFASRLNAEQFARRMQREGFSNLAYQTTPEITRVVIRNLSPQEVLDQIAVLEAKGITEYIVRARAN